MDQNKLLSEPTNAANPLLLRAEIDRVIALVEKATATPVPVSSTNAVYGGKWPAIIDFVEAYRKKVMWTALAFSLVLAFMVALKDFFPRHPLLPLALVIALLAQLCGLSILLSDILVAVPTFYELKKNPFKFFFDQLRSTVTFDLQMVSDLALCEPNAVRYVAKHYQYHRVVLEKRGGTISGNIDRLGLFPTVGAVIILWSQLSASPIGRWAVMLVPIIFIFHIMNLYFFGLQQRMDRVIAGLEYSVASSKA